VAGIANVVIKITAQTADAVSGIGKVNGELGKTQTSGQKFAAGIQSAAIPAAAALTALTAVAIKSAKAAAEDQASREQLDSQIRRLTGASDSALAANEAWIDSTSRSVGIMDDELRPALAGLVRATGDVTKAHDLMRLALDTSAATGKPLASVTAALSKAYGGSYGALTKLDPALKSVATSGAKFADVQAALNKQVEGAAAGHAETAAGQYAKMQVSIAELQESIGYALIPALEALLPSVVAVVNVIGGHTNVIVGFAVAVAGLSAAVLVANFALKVAAVVTKVYGFAVKTMAGETKLAAAAQWLWNAALTANPIGLVVVALAALAVGIVIAYRHSATFRSIVNSAFSAVAATARTAWSAISAVGSMIRSLAGLGGALRSGLVSAMNAIAGAIQTVVGWVERLISAIGRIHFPHIPSIPGLNVAGLGYGYGGVATPAGLSSSSTGGGFRSGPSYVINVSGAIDPESTAIAIRQALERYDRRRGRGFRAVQP
jgi:hypothetical protein